MNTQEFAEWLRETSEEWNSLHRARRFAEPQDHYHTGYARGYKEAVSDILHKLATLDSSHDLPSTKG